MYTIEWKGSSSEGGKASYANIKTNNLILLDSNDNEDDDDDGDDNGNSNSDDDNFNETWSIVRVIPTDEEHVECRNDGCTDQAVATWATDKDPEDKWDLCDKCQREELGGWPVGVHPIKHSTTRKGTDILHLKNEKGVTKRSASANAVACYEKWLANAIKYGGNRVIIDKKLARKTIFTALFRAFCPLNFNDLYKVRANPCAFTQN